MSDVEKAVWNSALANNSVQIDIIGGEGDNNEDNANWANAINVAYQVKDNAITFQFSVCDEYPYNFKLNNAYQLTFTVLDEDTKTPVASIVLPFEFKQPTLDIARVSGEKAIWTSDTELKLYGDLVGTKYMYAPLYEAFTTAYAKKYSDKVPNAEYYLLNYNNKSKIFYDGLFMNTSWGDSSWGAGKVVSLEDLAYSSKAEEWGTSIHVSDVQEKTKFPIHAEYTFYGVYPATEDQVKDFNLIFASLLGDAKDENIVTKEPDYTVHNVTREVILTDNNFTLIDALGDPFYLFDGVKADGNIDERSEMNHRQGFEEGTEGFARDFELQDAKITVKDINGNVIANDGDITRGTIGTATVAPTTGKITVTGGNVALYDNTETRTRGWAAAAAGDKFVITNLPATQAKPNYAAIPGGIMIQLPTTIGTTEPVTVEFELVDVFGVTKTLSVVVKANK